MLGFNIKLDSGGGRGICMFSIHKDGRYSVLQINERIEIDPIVKEEKV